VEWSVDLQDKMQLLSPAQRRAITRILLGEAAGVPLTRLLKTSYSCPHCGLVIGRSGETKEARKAALADHKAECDVDQKWIFAANYATYYGRWRRSAYFCECLSEARAEFIGFALGEAARILQTGTPEAARELVRQIAEGTKDFDKRSAAIALLDRADIKTAGKVDDSMARWLAELRKADEPMADDGPEGDDVSDGEVPSEPEPGEDTQ
jgi:predicted RNA-binding Zn-ribbon protein involved in translation (DUF1610 family)